MLLSGGLQGWQHRHGAEAVGAQVGHLDAAQRPDVNRELDRQVVPAVAPRRFRLTRPRELSRPRALRRRLDFGHVLECA